MSSGLRGSGLSIADLPRASQGELTDGFGRVIRYLRVSLTTDCNLRCLYCRPTAARRSSPGSRPLSDDDIVRIVEAAASLGVRTIRFTGGEPLLRPDLVAIVRRVSSIEGITDVSMTTNGILLADRARELAEAGLTRVNISLDSLDPTEYRRITGRDELPSVLRAIDAALAAGLHPVKVNAVIGLSPRWKEDALGIAQLAARWPLCVRFIERMPTQSDGQFHTDGMDGLLDLIGQVWDLTPTAGPAGGGPARYFRISPGGGWIGLITPISEPFCSSCNRLRLSSLGRLYPCLFSDAAVDLRPALQRPTFDQAVGLRQAFRLAARAKPRSHGPPSLLRLREMADIGG